jgi:hypothetical protein
MLLVFAGLVDNTLFEAQVVTLDKPLNVRGCEGGCEGIGGSEGEKRGGEKRRGRTGREGKREGRNNEGRERGKREGEG